MAKLPIVYTLSALFLLPCHTVMATQYLSTEGTDPDSDAMEYKVLETSLSKDSMPDNSSVELAKRSIVQYQELIGNLEKDYGAYHEQISEELLGMGQAYKELGQYEEAVSTYTRALHINRINQGLYNPNQLPILESIIENNTKLGDWERLDQNYHYLYWVNRRLYGDDDPRLLPVINRLGRWHLSAYQLEEDSTPFRHLLTAGQLYEDAITIIESHNGAHDPSLINPLYGLVLTNYHMAVHAGNADDFEEIRFSARSMSHFERMLEEQEARQELIYDSYRNGKNAMLRIVDIFNDNPDLPQDAHAMALMHLGDWYLLFNRRHTASETYQEAYAKLINSGMDQPGVDKIFSRPRYLPTLTLPMDYQQEPKKDDNYVIAKFDVTETGMARNIQIIESKPADSKSLQRRAKRSIKAARFRPRFENGQAVATAGVNIRYIFEE